MTSSSPVRHLVLFRLHAEDPEERARLGDQIRTRLEGLVGTLPGLTSLEVRPDLGDAAGHWHLALVSEHPSAGGLAAYQRDPAHQEVAQWIATIADRAVVDYALD